MTAEEKKELLNGLFNGATIYGGQAIFFGDNNNVSFSSSDRNMMDNDQCPSPDKMAKAVENTISRGLWWGNTAWSVIYRIMQMKGYKGNVMDFIYDVSTWPFSKEPSFRCTKDSVYKPIQSGKIIRDLSHWQEDGAQRQYIVLATELKKELEEGDRG